MFGETTAVMKHLNVLLIAAIPIMHSAVLAQVWCPPGATWTYDALESNGGFIRSSYIGDTLIDGELAQIIDRYAAVQQAPDFGEPVITYTPVAMITKYDANVVYLRGGQSWDTLYWFGAQVGSRWTAPHMNCSPFYVSTIGTTDFDGVSLRYVNIGPVHRIYERFGLLWHIHLHCPGFIILEPAGLRCYSDHELSVEFGSTECEAFVGVGEHLAHIENPPFPNPGSTQFTLTLPPSPHTITLFDAMGRLVLEQRTADERPVIATEGLLTGMYMVRIVDGNNMVQLHHWMKQ